MMRNELLETVRSIYFGPARNDLITPMLDKLEEALPHSAISDLIFWNPVELTPEQVVDEATRREAEYARNCNHE